MLAASGFQGKEWQRMKSFGYIISALIGFAIGHYLLEGAAAAFASILISYHLYLVFLVLMAKHEKGFSLPIGQTILTHLAFLVVVAGLPYMREQIPFFSVISLLVPGLAPFETQWLFSGQGEKAGKAEKQEPSGPVIPTAEDHQEFLVYLRQKHRPFKKAGMTIDDEFKAWLIDRSNKKAAAGMMTAAASEQAQELE
jgi:hypothetical protein